MKQIANRLIQPITSNNAGAGTGLGLFFDADEAREIVKPSLTRPRPALLLRRQHIALIGRRCPKPQHFRAVASRRRIEVRAAFGAERLFPLPAALCRFDKHLQVT